MGRTVLCDTSVPRLDTALAARGLALMPAATADLAAASIACDAAVLLVGWRRDERRASELVERLRADGARGAILLLPAAPDPEAVIEALDADADDAVSADAPADEIAARIDARIRHAAERWLVLGELRIDRLNRQVSRAGRALPLLPREYALLLHFARHPGACIGRAELLRAVWGLPFDPGTNVVEVHLSRLRAKLDRGFTMPMLHTEKGRGYRLSPPAIAARPAPG
jgi:two-component system OmpR family response regulator